MLNIVLCSRQWLMSVLQDYDNYVNHIPYLPYSACMEQQQQCLIIIFTTTIITSVSSVSDCQYGTQWTQVPGWHMSHNVTISNHYTNILHSPDLINIFKFYNFSVSADSKDRQSTSDYYSITRSLGRQPKTGNSSSHMARTEIIQHPAFRHLIPPSHCLQTKTSSINNNYSRIYSGVNRGVYDEATNVDEIPELYRGDAVSSDSDYDTIYSNKEDNGTLLPIGKISSHISSWIMIVIIRRI